MWTEKLPRIMAGVVVETKAASQVLMIIMLNEKSKKENKIYGTISFMKIKDTCKITLQTL